MLQAKSLESAWGELEGGIEVGTDALRLFTALWVGLPYEAEETTVLPMAAVDILESHIDPKKAAELRLTAVAGESPGAETTTDDHERPDRMVRGLTTFGDLKGWGVSEEMWLENFALPMGSKTASMKDWAEDTGFPMSEIKTAAQMMVDSK